MLTLLRKDAILAINVDIISGYILIDDFVKSVSEIDFQNDETGAIYLLQKRMSHYIVMISMRNLNNFQ